MGVKLRMRYGRIYLSICSGGRRWMESTGLSISDNKTQQKEVLRVAELVRSKREIQLSLQMAGVADPQAGRVMLAEYAKTTLQSDPENSKLKKALPWIIKLAPNIRLDSLTPAWFETFQIELKKNKSEKGKYLSPSTQENYACAVRALLKKAVRDGVIVKDPSEGVKHISIPEIHKSTLTTAEIRKLVNTPIAGIVGSEVKRAFLFAVCTGMRISDIKTLTWSNINIDSMQIEKQQHKTKIMVYIPIKKEAWLMINDDEKHAAEDLIFPKLSGTQTNTNHYLKRWAKNAGIVKQVSWHTARYTDATLLFESGADLYTVQKLLGHTKITTTQKYTRVSDAKKRQAIDALDDYGISDISASS